MELKLIFRRNMTKFMSVWVPLVCQPNLNFNCIKLSMFSYKKKTFNLKSNKAYVNQRAYEDVPAESLHSSSQKNLIHFLHKNRLNKQCSSYFYTIK